MSTTSREIEIAPVTRTPQWVVAFNESQSSQNIEEGLTSNPPVSTKDTLLDLLKKTLFWSGSGSASCCLSLLIGKVILDNAGYPVESDDNSLGFAAIGGCMSYFLFKLLAEVVKKTFKPCVNPYQTAEEEEPQDSKIEMNQMILQSFLLNLGGIFLGIVVLLHHQAPAESKDEVIASCVGTGVLFGSLGLMNGLRSC